MSKNKILHSYQKGQMLLLVILVMVVALTIGLSVATRNITNIKTTQDEENSQRAFSAAEAGIERALKTGAAVPDSVLSNAANYKAEVITVGDKPFILNGGGNVLANEGVDLQLATRIDDPPYFDALKGFYSGTVTVYWGSTAQSCDNAALEVLVIENFSSPTVTHHVFDSCDTARGVNNNFPTATSVNGYQIESDKFFNSAAISISNGVIARIIPLYSATKIGIVATGLPEQEKRIVATGTVNNTTRKISATKKFPSVPNEFFQYLLLARDN